jgi:hypothetical protein
MHTLRMPAVDHPSSASPTAVAIPSRHRPRPTPRDRATASYAPDRQPRVRTGAWRRDLRESGGGESEGFRREGRRAVGRGQEGEEDRTVLSVDAEVSRQSERKIDTKRYRCFPNEIGCLGVEILAYICTDSTHALHLDIEPNSLTLQTTEFGPVFPNSDFRAQF